jgi:hypothetical protein
MVEISFLLELVNTILLLGGSILLIFWKKIKGKSKNNELIRNVGLSVLLIGFYKLTSIAFQIIKFDEWIFSVSSIPALLGIIRLMLNLFSYLEDKQ